MTHFYLNFLFSETPTKFLGTDRAGLEDYLAERKRRNVDREQETKDREKDEKKRKDKKEKDRKMKGDKDGEKKVIFISILKFS